MKRVLSILLVVAMLFAFAALCACSDEKDTKEDTTPADNAASDEENKDADDTASDDQNSDYAEMYEFFGVDSVPDEEYSWQQYQALKNGEITLGFCLEDFSQNYLVTMADNFMTRWEEKGGVNGGIFSADGDVTTQITQIENCVQLGLDLICVASSSVASLSNACETAQAGGVKVVVRGEASVENCGFVPNALETYNNAEFGWYLGDMVLYYMQTYQPEYYEKGVKIATGELSQASNLIELFDGLRARLAKDNKGEVVYVKDWCLTLDDGYNVGEESLTYDPEVRAFLTFDEAPAMGYSNYIMGRSDLDPAEFISQATSASKESSEMWEQSKNNESVLRGYCGSAWEDVSVVIWNASWKVLMGLVDDSEGWIEYGDVNTDNAYGYTVGAGGFTYEG